MSLKQIVTIARTLKVHPAVFFLDEPLAGWQDKKTFYVFATTEDLDKMFDHLRSLLSSEIGKLRHEIHKPFRITKTKKKTRKKS